MLFFDGLDVGFILILKIRRGMNHRKINISCSYRKSCIDGHPAQSVVNVPTTLSLLTNDDLLCKCFWYIFIRPQPVLL